MSIAAALRYARPMLVFDRGEQRFCYRVAAVIVDRGRVLIQLVEEGPDTSETPFYCLPGGRVEHGETALECIAREMREELEEEVQVERPLWRAEVSAAFGASAREAASLLSGFRRSLRSHVVRIACGFPDWSPPSRRAIYRGHNSGAHV